MVRCSLVIAGGALALCTAAVAWALPEPTVALPTETHTFQLRVLTNILSSVPGNKIKFKQAGLTSVYLTNSGAYTPRVPLQAGLPLTLTIKQKNLPEGIAVGQTTSRTYASLGVDHGVFDLLTLFQPILQPVILDSASPHHAIGLGRRWRFSPVEESSYLFPANVGVLMTPREILAFQDYYDLQLDHSDYRMGLVVHVADAESLGSGMALEMDFESYGFDAIPGLDSYYIAFNALDSGSGNFDVSPALWNDSNAPDVAYYFLNGTLGKGMNLLLFREGEIESMVELLANPPSFPPVAQQMYGGIQPLSGGAKNCSPEAPQAPDGLCCTDPPPPCEDSWICADSGCTGITAADCTSTNVPVGEPFCGTADSTGQPSSTSVTWTTTFSGGVTATIEILGVVVEGSAGAESSKSTTQPLSVGNGAGGCGECAQAFQQITTCAKTCIVHERTFCWGCLTWWCLDTPCPMACVSATGTSVEHCSRTNCP